MNRSRTTLVALLVLLTACAGSSSPTRQSGSGGRSTADARVKTYRGQVPPDVFTQGTWVSSAGPTSLAQLRGRAVYVQFAFPQ